MTKIIKIFAITACLFTAFNAYAFAEKPTCRVGGCSGQVCESTFNAPTITTCEWREEYSCYKTAKCEVQNDGKCGWTMSKELEKCLAEKKKPINIMDTK